MGEKQHIAQEYKKKMDEKWAQYYESNKPFTDKVIAEMQADNATYKKLAEEATREWLKEQKNAE